MGPSFRWDDVADNLRILTAPNLPSFQRKLESIAFQRWSSLGCQRHGNMGPSFRWDDVADNPRIPTVIDLPSFQRKLESIVFQ